MTEEYTGKPRILVADDEEVVREMTGDILNPHFGDRYELIFFGDGIELSRVLDKGLDEVALVLTDNTMPGMNGEQVIEEYSTRGLGTNVGVILRTGEPRIDFRDRLRDCTWIYLGKPGRNSELIETVQKALDWYGKAA